MKQMLSSRQILLLTALSSLVFSGGCATRRPEAIRVETLVKDTRSWNGAVLPAYPQTQPEVTLLRITIPPGAKLPLHTHPVINSGILLEGELTVETATGERIELKAGDALIEVVNTPHAGRNPGRKPAVILVFYAGAVGLPVSEAVKIDPPPTTDSNP